MEPLQLSPTPFPILRTERFVLRQLTLDDAHDIFKIRSDPRVMQYIGKPKAKEISDCEDLIERVTHDLRTGSSISWGICSHDESIVIGMIGFYRIQHDHARGELGYALGADHWRKGVMLEAARAVIAHGFATIGFHSIEARTDPSNTASNGLLNALQFDHEGTLKESYYWNGTYANVNVYGLLNKKAGLQRDHL